VSETTARSRTLGDSLAAEFERIYRANAGAITEYFARRCTDPHTVADLVSDTFVQAIKSFGTFDPRRGTARAWVFGIARRVFATYCETINHQQDKARRLGSRRELDADEVGELIHRIDAERRGRHLLTELEALPELDRALVEMVDLAGLQPKEAASALGISRGAARTRLMRARARLRKTIQDSTQEMSR
jgi:RNA polymerase sigma factor (sigma-70 family)